MSIHGKNIIGNNLSAQGTSSFNAYEVATNTPLLEKFFEATPQEINAAILLAAEAFSVYKNKSGKEKAVFLECIATEIESLDMELIETASKETGLPIARITGERGRTTGQLRLFAAQLIEGSWVNAIIDKALPDRKPLPRVDIRQMQIAIGPVAVFGASNFPLAFSVAGGDTASALAAGCTVVFKAHPAHPATCELVGGAIIRAAIKCNMPEGVFSMVHGISHEVGQTLVTNPIIKAVGFTGSLKGGKALYDAAVRREEPIPVYAEMSSVNPVIFLPEILAQKSADLAESFAASIVLGGGQFCTNPGIFLLIKNTDSDNFINLLATAITTKPSVQLLTNGIFDAYCKGISHQRNTEGATGLTEFDATSAQPHLLQIDAQMLIKNPSLTEEVFGPSSVAIVAKDMKELTECILHLKGQLTASLHGTEDELKNSASLINLLKEKAGRLNINSFPTGVEVGNAIVHSGPYPATTDSRSTSVGTQSIYRFTRPICFQEFPEHLLPDELKESNPLQISRLVNGIKM
jgi:NADP-dependent aldehyde dehydrogenase